MILSPKKAWQRRSEIESVWKWFCSQVRFEVCRLQFLLLRVVVRSKAHLLHLGIEHAKQCNGATHYRAKGTSAMWSLDEQKAVWAKSSLSSILAPTPPTSWDECRVSTSVRRRCIMLQCFCFFDSDTIPNWLERSKRSKRQMAIPISLSDI